MTKLTHYDIVGSFLRPEELKKAREKFNEGNIQQAELTHVENQAIDQLIQKEESLGLKFVTDGEFRRSWWHLDFIWNLNGVAKYNYHWNNRSNVSIVLGLVASKSGKLEKKEALIKRINEATELVPLKNLALSTQCGFASTEEGNVLTPEDQWNKIKLVVDTAKQVWG